MSLIERLLHPFHFFAGTYLAALVIGIVCGYLGVFIALRRVIFVGVALAEISAAGMAAAFYTFTLLGLGEVGHAEAFRYSVLAGSVLFSFGGVLLFSRPPADGKISREAMIGLAYATAAGLSILFVWKSAQGLEELKNILSGSVLFVDRTQLLTLVATGAVLALIHGLFFKEFVFVSFDPIMARTLGLRARGYDLLLFVTIGVAIAISLRTGGVLTVFAFLVIPAQAGLLIGGRLGTAFVHALAQAAVGSAVGLYISDAWDLPTGPATAVTLTVLLLATGAAVKLGHRARRILIVSEVAAAAVAIALALFSLGVYAGWIEARFEVPHAAEPGPVEPAPPARTEAPAGAGGAASGALAEGDLPTLLRELGADNEDRRDEALTAIVSRRDPAAVPSITRALQGASGTWRLHLALALTSLGSARGVEVLIDFLASDGSPFDRSEALDRLRAISGDDLGYDPEKEPEENGPAIARWREWWQHHRGQLRWNRETGMLKAEPH